MQIINNVTEMLKLDFFNPTPSGNYKWQLSDAATIEEMQMLMDAIQVVVDKVNQ